MIGMLKSTQIEELLMHMLVGRIACCSGEVPYVVPISYVYDGKYLYFHTHEGEKITIMRNNPQVCFQVDHMHNMAHWESVIVRGIYEEVTDTQERESALKLLVTRTLPLISSVTTHLGKSWPFVPEKLNDEIPGVVFRIKITEKTGRFESNMHSAIISG